MSEAQCMDHESKERKTSRYLKLTVGLKIFFLKKFVKIFIINNVSIVGQTVQVMENGSKPLNSKIKMTQFKIF